MLAQKTILMVYLCSTFVYFCFTTKSKTLFIENYYFTLIMRISNKLVILNLTVLANDLIFVL